MDQTAHEASLRREMTVARDVWRESEPVAKLGENQNPTDFRDQQHTAAWGEARFLVSGKENDATAVRVASELATEGRGLSGTDAVQLAEAITTVYGTEKASARENLSFLADVARTIASAGEGVTPAVDGRYIDYVVGKGAIHDPETAKRLDELASGKDILSFAVADAPSFGLGSATIHNGPIRWQIIDGNTGEIADNADHPDATSALASMRKLAGLGITYEGIDASEHEQSWMKSLYMPGEKVRFDTEAKVYGIDPHDTMDALGTDPLTISKSIVRGVEVSDGMGGTRDSVILEYEFEGKDGRHNAKQFMEEGGRDHMYGVVLVRDDRMWAVPLVEDEIKQDGTMVLDGPAREIVGFTGRDQDQLDPAGFPGMREYVKEESGVAGEFYLQPRDGYRDPGPVNLLNSPWMSGVSDQEKAIAEQAIDKAIAKETRERDYPVGVLVDQMRHVSKAWRAERPVGDVPVDPEVGLSAAKEEARRLMRGHDIRDPNVRIAAAMVATENRPINGRGGDLIATSLADSMAPAPEGTRKGVLAQASSLLSGSMAVQGAKPLSRSSGAEDLDPAMVAAASRRGTER